MSVRLHPKVRPALLASSNTPLIWVCATFIPSTDSHNCTVAQNAYELLLLSKGPVTMDRNGNVEHDARSCDQQVTKNEKLIIPVSIDAPLAQG